MSSDLAKTWIEYHAERDEALFWAFEKLNELCQDQPEDAWSIVLEISELTDDPRVLSNLAAGPLEDILTKHGHDFIDRFEIHTRQNPGFVPVAKGVWISGAPKDIEERVHEVQGRYS